VNSDIGKNLAINLDIRFLQAIHKTAVAQAIHACRGIDTGNPQCAELAFFLAAIAVGVLAGLIHSLLGYTINILARTAVTLGAINYFLVTSVCNDTAFDSWHCSVSLYVRQHAANEAGVCFMNHVTATQVTLALGALLGQDVAHMGRTATKTATGSFLEALRGTAIGFDLWHCQTPQSCRLQFKI